MKSKKVELKQGSSYPNKKDNKKSCWCFRKDVVSGRIVAWVVGVSVLVIIISVFFPKRYPHPSFPFLPNDAPVEKLEMLIVKTLEIQKKINGQFNSLPQPADPDNTEQIQIRQNISKQLNENTVLIEQTKTLYTKTTDKKSHFLFECEDIERDLNEAASLIENPLDDTKTKKLLQRTLSTLKRIDLRFLDKIEENNQ